MFLTEWLIFFATATEYGLNMAKAHLYTILIQNPILLYHL